MIMMKMRSVKKFPVAIFIFSGFILIGWSQAHAEINSMQGHQHHDMQHMHNMEGEDVTAEIKTEPETITAGTQATIVCAIKDREGKPVKDLSIHHDRLVHVIIASQDFGIFAHIHPEDFGPITPEMKKTARYPVRATFPKAGRYIIGIDFSVKEQLFSKHFLVDVIGEPKMKSRKEDLSKEKLFSDLAVTFSTMPERITAGKEVMLSYFFKKNGKPVTDLEPYLSAPMHLAIVSTDLHNYIHSHGELPGMLVMGHGEHHMMEMTVPEKFGPKIEVHVIFPAQGTYQIFGQVEHEGKVILTSFMVKVE